MKKKRTYTDATAPHVPADERDIMAALLKVPPPPDDPGKPNRAAFKRKRR